MISEFASGKKYSQLLERQTISTC